MSAVKAFDMSRYWRLVSVEGGRVNGTFWVQWPKYGMTWVSAVDVAIWDEELRRTWGHALTRGELSATVKDGTVDIRVLRPGVNEEFVRECEVDIKDAILAAVAAVEWPDDAEAGESQ